MVCACQPAPCGCLKGSSGHLAPGSLGLFLEHSPILMGSLEFPFSMKSCQFFSVSFAPLTYLRCVFPQRQRTVHREAVCPSSQAAWAHISSPASATALDLPSLNLSLISEPWQNLEEILKVSGATLTGGGE